MPEAAIAEKLDLHAGRRVARPAGVKLDQALDMAAQHLGHRAGGKDGLRGCGHTGPQIKSNEYPTARP
jgi:hypothetical protein